MSTYSTLYDELTGMITKHMVEVSQYVPTVNYVTEKAPDNLLACIDRLDEIVETPADTASDELYREACQCQDDLRAFLRIMNHSPALFNTDDTNVGQLMVRVDTWRRQVARALKLTLSTKDVWELIAPAVPDHLVDLGNGQYEARWWKPVPIMDVEILKVTEGVFLCGEPFEPQGLSGGLALRFSIVA